MSHLLADEITRILAQFAGRGFDTQVVALKGPVQDGMSYSWQLVSEPYDDVYVTVQTQKPQFGETTVARVEIQGLQQPRQILPDLEDLRDFFQAAKLVPRN